LSNSKSQNRGLNGKRTTSEGNKEADNKKNALKAITFKMKGGKANCKAHLQGKCQNRKCKDPHYSQLIIVENYPLRD